MKNPLPNITDTAQATSGPFPELLGSDTPPSTATSLVTLIMPGFAKVKTILALCHYQSPAAIMRLDMNNSSCVEKLKKAVVQTFGCSLDSPMDYDSLASAIHEKTGTPISSTTLK